MQHEPLCQHSNHTQALLSPAVCTYCALIRRVREEERARQWPDPMLDTYLYDVEGRPE